MSYNSTPNWTDDDENEVPRLTPEEIAHIFSTASVEPPLLSYDPSYSMAMLQSPVLYNQSYHIDPQFSDQIVVPTLPNSTNVNSNFVGSHFLHHLNEESTLYQLEPHIEPHTTLHNYLTSQNPKIRGPMEDPTLRRKNAKSPEFAFIWWDIRNVRVWDDFNFHTVLAMPNLQSLLLCPLPVSYLSESSYSPEDLQLGDKASFAKLVGLSFCLKVTTSLQLTMALGELNLSMVLANSTNSGCEIIGLYQDATFNIQHVQNRVPGFIKSCREWNSLMQAGADGKRREYLQVLSQLQRYMRDHNTRYGYILTEQELVCVRAVTDQQDRPIFGCLDVSLPITWNQHGPGRLTIMLALWYLHMLAKRDPLPGQFGWQLNIPPSPRYGARQWTLPKDAWIPTPTNDDLAIAQSIRGWSEATDPLTLNETLL